MTATPKKTHTSPEVEETLRYNQQQALPFNEMSEPRHFVQFYENDDFLLDSVSRFIGMGLGAGDACIVIATKAHQGPLEERLKANGIDLAIARTQGRYISLDALETLSQFMLDGMPEPERFATIIRSVIAEATMEQRHVRIFGEMVELLWSEGNQDAAISLEELWNDLFTATHAFSLLCAYSMRDFAGEAYRVSFTEICNQHSHVIPDESYTTLTNPIERLRAISLLQQKANALEAEIADRKRAEQASLYLASIVESSEDAIFGKNLEGIITSWNTAAERIFGYSAQEIVGQPVTLLYMPGQQDEFIQIMDRIRRGERVNHHETTRVRKDGTILTVSVSVSPIKDKDGTIIGASDITRDITEHRRLEAKFQRLFDSNLIGVFVSDFAGTFLEANDTFLNLLGYTRAELQARAIHRDALTSPEYHLISASAVQALQETGSSGPYEKVYLHKSGKQIPVLIAVARIEHTETCIGFVLDISERKELDKRKDEFISMASHELKTPITSLKGFLNLLQRHLTAQGGEKALYYLARMDVQVNKLTKLINDLLDLSKMQTGQLVYREEYFRIDMLVQEIIENIQGTTQTHHLLLEDQTQAEVFGDRDRIGQVLINLLTNAIKYSPGADTILVHVAKDQNKALVSVQDFGMGIAEEYQHKIFERFYQVTDPEEKTYPGLGMGLYISCEIVKRHGGQLWVESKKGQGATFHFTLPLPENGKKPASS